MATPDLAGDTELVVRHGLPVLTWPVLAPVAEVAVTTSEGGISGGAFATLNLGLHVGDDPEAVVENRRRAARAVGAGLDDLVLADQVHGAQVVVVGSEHRGRGARDVADAVARADGLVTCEPGPVLVILVADCVPIVLCDPVAGVLAAVHAGWRGTLAGVGPAVVATMAGLGADPGRMVAGIGPAISPERYQVGPEVAEAARDVLGADAGPLLRPDDEGRWRLDLPAANHRLLVRAGIPPAQIHLAGAHTGPPGPFFSDRTRRPCGRFGLLARLRGRG